jgi:peptidoglycan/LPS O-acetylase OafA/YrhL
MGYSAGVIVLVAGLARGRNPAAPIRFLSEATLTLYLYHRIFQLLVDPLVAAWNPGARIAVNVMVGLLGASALALLGRRLLGPRRSRLLLGF